MCISLAVNVSLRCVCKCVCEYDYECGCEYWSENVIIDPDCVWSPEKKPLRVCIPILSDKSLRACSCERICQECGGSAK